MNGLRKRAQDFNGTAKPVSWLAHNVLEEWPTSKGVENFFPTKHYLP
jgi:hypothetical protein